LNKGIEVRHLKSKIKGVRIRGICSIVPAHVSYFEDELKSFPFSEASSRRLAKVMGFREHRIADNKTTLTDLSAYAMNYLFANGFISKDKIQAVIFVAHQADHPVPGNSKVLHGNLRLSKDTHCIDMYENCIGFISGLYSACSLIAGGGLDEVVLVTATSGACYANIKDRNTYPLCGDAAGITVISKSPNPEDEISFVFHHDGSRRSVLLTPAGGMRMPATAQTAEMHQDKMGNFRSLNNMYMDGTAVFQFVMEEVPPLVEEICNYAGVRKEDIAYHLTHQPNRFMLQKLADLMEVPRERLFSNVVENFGNSSCATIPVDVCFNLGRRLLTEHPLVCFSAFGAGLSVAAAIARLGKLDFCDLIEHPGNGQIEYTRKGANS